jgi:hypothetical protein
VDCGFFHLGRFAPVVGHSLVFLPEKPMAYQIEAMTNDRLREEVGDISLVPPEDRVSGPGSSDRRSEKNFSSSGRHLDADSEVPEAEN